MSDVSKEADAHMLGLTQNWGDPRAEYKHNWAAFMQVAIRAAYQLYAVDESTAPADVERTNAGIIGTAWGLVRLERFYEGELGQVRTWAVSENAEELIARLLSLGRLAERTPEEKAKPAWADECKKAWAALEAAIARFVRDAPDEGIEFHDDADAWS